MFHVIITLFSVDTRNVSVRMKYVCFWICRRILFCNNFSNALKLSLIRDNIMYDIIIIPLGVFI